MEKEKREEIQFPSLDELFSSQEEREDAKLKRIYEIPLTEIDPFPDHPFKVRDDEDMENLIESIRINGLITPVMARKTPSGRYELISGHRRLRACEILGIETVRCEVVEMTKEQATIFMVESNFQRSEILPSEKAFAYKMRYEAMKKQISRMEENKSKGMDYSGAPVGPQLSRARDRLANESPDSREQIRRYIRLTELIPELLEMVDEGKIAMRPAVELSYLEHRQRDFIIRHPVILVRHDYYFFYP